jgi:deoxyribodipyrimidine photolyase-like uncharacterized protein
MEATLVYPHQLFDPHPAVREGRPVYLIEEPLFFGTDLEWPMPMHKQKLVLHIASMSAYEVELEKKGIEVRRVTVSRGGDSVEMLEKALPMKITELHVADVGDDVLGRRIRRFAEGRGIRLMVPNVYGMSQFADRGTFTTKPYLSGSNYILKMSDEAKGDWCATWDALFWTFIADHPEFFLSNPRLSMMARTWEKMPPEKQQAHRLESQRFLTSLDQ